MNVHVLESNVNYNEIYVYFNKRRRFPKKNRNIIMEILLSKMAVLWLAITNI
jgi:hypothetical protein